MSRLGSGRLRVVHVIPDMGVGGAEILVRSLVQWQLQRCDVVVVTMFDGDERSIDGPSGAPPAKVVSLHKKLGPDVRMVPRLRRVLEQLEPDVVHTHRYSIAYMLPVLVTLRVPAVHTLHTTPAAEARAWWLRAAYKLAFRRRIASVSISDANARLYETIYGAPPDAVVPHGIDASRFSSTTDARWRAVHGLDEEDFVVASVARLAPEKRHRDLFDAFAQVKQEIPHARLVLAGDGPLRRELEEDVRRRPDIADAVLFLGSVGDVPAVLAGADVFALASEREGVPLSILEAMAAGRPVVATAVGGVPDVVVDGSTGLLVPPADPRALADALVRLGRSVDVRTAMGQEARRRVVERHSIDGMGDAYMQVYRSAIDG